MHTERKKEDAICINISRRKKKRKKERKKEMHLNIRDDEAYIHTCTNK